MSGFKLLAITPLDGCDSKYRKNLEIGKIYQFYSNYKIEIENDFTKIKSVNPIKKDIVEIYKLKNGINLNFSAVVGKNGTGKSTLFELLYYTIYAISSEKSDNQRKILNTELEDLKLKLKEANDYYDLMVNCMNIKDKNDKNETLNKFEIEVLEKDYKDPFIIALEIQKQYNIDLNKRKISDSQSYLKALKNELHDNVIRIILADIKDEDDWECHFRKHFSCSILYESNGIIKEIIYKNSSFFYSEFHPSREEKIVDINKFDLSSFFYSVSLNFSHHSLNSITLGKWINKLFHKNDAYTTPVVINPMRNTGNFNINHELKLSKERLMANLLYDLVQKKKSLLIGKYKISKFIFSPKVLSNLPVFDFTENFISELLSSEIFKKQLNIKQLDDRIEYWEFAIGYLERKINRIEENYGYLIFKQDSLFNRKEQLDNFLLFDKSHITKKVRQVINFLKTTYVIKNRNFWKIPDETVRIELSEKKMLDWLNLFGLNLNKTSPSELVEIGLPGFFNIDFLLEDKNGNKIEFSKLSSGEQQMILNTNSILYHLFNLESIHDNIDDKKYEIDRVKYTDINIILDEVELYYHPEMQRRLISDLVNSLERVKKVKSDGIKSINFCILTHSPFILSDIPSSNVLSLNEEEIITRNETFGANIHEMLLGNFFMDSVTGEFVRNQINEILDFYNIVRKTNYQTEIKKLKKIYDLKREQYIYFKENIGEDVVRGILSNHINFIEEKLNYEKN